MTDEDFEGDLGPEPAGERPAQAPEPSDIPWGLVGFLVGAILFTTFVLQNGQDVDLRFLGWDGSFPLSFIIVIVAVVAVILDEILGIALRRRRRRRRAEREELRRLRDAE